jgi:signal transduction histidine kinase/CheY-like chemotaxis protein
VGEESGPDDISEATGGTAARVRSVFAAGGPIGADLARVDWGATPIGPPGGWSPSLVAAVEILLTSRFAMWMAWGPDLTFLCNETYRRDTLGAKHPWALGRPASQVWEEIWDDIGPRIDRVMATGEATWDEALLLYLERSGYLEESYHTFSYSPLRDDAGTISGMLCVVSEETVRVIGERRLSTLRDLATRLAAARTEADVLAATETALAADARSLPFAATYLFDDAHGTARLAWRTGVEAGAGGVPATIDLCSADAVGWRLGEVAAGRSVTADLADVVGTRPDAADGRALIVPLTSRDLEQPAGFLLAGLSRFRPLDDGYRGFVGLVAGQVAAGIANVRAYEAERRRAEALAELDRAKTTFFTNVSHELRTPLTLLLGPAEEALADREAPLPDGQRRRIEIVQRNGERLLKLVNTLLDFSRLESGRTVPVLEPTALGALTAELTSMFESAAEMAGLTLRVLRPDPAAEAIVAVDREMWAKIVLNLVSNAVKFTFDGGITVAVGATATHAELRVSDTGTGIEPAEQSRLFERFHRVSGARSRTHEGSGIGLALVAELVALLGGTIGVASEPGVGTTFTVRIPADAGEPAGVGVAHPSTVALATGFVAEASRWMAVPGTAHPGEAPEPGASREDAPDAGGVPPVRPDRRPRILVVDDNADMRDHIVGLLADRYDVRTASDGAAALVMARRDPPDLVLTDVMMPRLDGFGLLAALAADPATTTVPVVMLSARAGDGAAVDALEAGADDYLIKPFTARELRARVGANLELERARRTKAHLERSQLLLDEAERLAGTGSWEVEVATGRIRGSAQFDRLVHLDTRTTADAVIDGVIDKLIHPEDTDRLRAALAGLKVEGNALDVECRVRPGGGETRTVRVRAVRSDDGRWLRGSLQDVTDQRRAEASILAATATQQAAKREHLIADELQRSLLPARTFDPEHLDVATYYRAGVQGTRVGGDWYDVIDLGAGRTALVLGDVMGRGVRAAAVMGQLRAAIRAYARLDLAPATILEHLDGIVRDLGEDQIVTCVYAVFDPADLSLTIANAGHLPPLLMLPDAPATRLDGAAGPPLGTGPMTLPAQRVVLEQGATFAFYTDGLVERRDRHLDAGIDALAAELARLDVAVDALPAALVEALVPSSVDDDIAVLVAHLAEVTPHSSLTRSVPFDRRAVGETRHFVAAALRDWQVPAATVESVTVASSELLTNAIRHGRSPVDIRLRRTPAHLVVEVLDGSAEMPTTDAGADGDPGRGLAVVELLADRWGVRPTPAGKAVWCSFSLPATP